MLNSLGERCTTKLTPRFVPLALVAVAAAILATGCALQRPSPTANGVASDAAAPTSDSQGGATRSTPTKPPATPTPASQQDSSVWPPPGVNVTHDRAMQIARSKCLGAEPEMSPVSNPRDPVVWLMTTAEYEGRAGARTAGYSTSRYVWAVQFLGESHTAVDRSSSGVTDYFAECAVDANDGQVQQINRSKTPFLLPEGIAPTLPRATSSVNSGRAVLTTEPVDFTREQVQDFINQHFGGPYGRTAPLPGYAQIELVRYTAPHCPPPAVPGAALTATAYAVATTESVPLIKTATARSMLAETQCELLLRSRPGKDQLTWLVVVPTQFQLNSCGPKSANGLIRTCWSSQILALLDAQSGEEFGDLAVGVNGPNLSASEFQELQRYAWSEGWWALWYQIKGHRGDRLPEGLAASLDRPNAPTPTPRPAPEILPLATPTPAGG